MVPSKAEVSNCICFSFSSLETRKGYSRDKWEYKGWFSNNVAQRATTLGYSLLRFEYPVKQKYLIVSASRVPASLALTPTEGRSFLV